LVSLLSGTLGTAVSLTVDCPSLGVEVAIPLMVAVAASPLGLASRLPGALAALAASVCSLVSAGALTAAATLSLGFQMASQNQDQG
jgi:hypothetical protein